MTLSSYKITAPRGIGVLYVRDGINVEKLLECQLGTQRLWPGVENKPLIMGFLKASDLSFQNFSENILHIKRLRAILMKGTLNEIPETLLNWLRGDKRVPDNVNISILHCEGEAMTIELSLHGIYVSGGGACTLQDPAAKPCSGCNWDRTRGNPGEHPNEGNKTSHG